MSSTDGYAPTVWEDAISVFQDETEEVEVLDDQRRRLPAAHREQIAQVTARRLNENHGTVNRLERILPNPDSRLNDLDVEHGSSDSQSDIEDSARDEFEDMAVAAIARRDYLRATTLIRKCLSETEKSATKVRRWNITLALLCCFQQEWDEAEALITAHPGYQKNNIHEYELHVLHALALQRMLRNNNDMASSLCKETIRRKKRKLGKNHESYIQSVSLLAEICVRQNDLDRATAYRMRIPSSVRLVLDVSEYLTASIHGAEDTRESQLQSAAFELPKSSPEPPSDLTTHPNIERNQGGRAYKGPEVAQHLTNQRQDSATVNGSPDRQPVEMAPHPAGSRRLSTQDTASYILKAAADLVNERPFRDLDLASQKATAHADHGQSPTIQEPLKQTSVGRDQPKDLPDSGSELQTSTEGSATSTKSSNPNDGRAKTADLRPKQSNMRENKERHFICSLNISASHTSIGFILTYPGYIVTKQSILETLGDQCRKAETVRNWGRNMANVREIPNKISYSTTVDDAQQFGWDIGNGSRIVDLSDTFIEANDATHRAIEKITSRLRSLAEFRTSQPRGLSEQGIRTAESVWSDFTERVKQAFRRYLQREFQSAYQKLALLSNTLILTIPAGWTSVTTTRMLRSLQSSGFLSNDKSLDKAVKVTTDLEAIVIFTLASESEKLSNKNLSLRHGQQIMICDIGIDRTRVACYRIVSLNPASIELRPTVDVKATHVGSSSADSQFLRYLRSLMELRMWARIDRKSIAGSYFRGPFGRDLEYIMRRFSEWRASLQKGPGDMTMRLPDTLGDFSSGPIHGGLLRISHEKMESFFEPTIHSILELIHAQAESCYQTFGTPIEYLILSNQEETMDYVTHTIADGIERAEAANTAWSVSVEFLHNKMGRVAAAEGAVLQSQWNKMRSWQPVQSSLGIRVYSESDNARRYCNFHRLQAYNLRSKIKRLRRKGELFLDAEPQVFAEELNIPWELLLWTDMTIEVVEWTDDSDANVDDRSYITFTDKHVVREVSKLRGRLARNLRFKSGDPPKKGGSDATVVVGVVMSANGKLETIDLIHEGQVLARSQAEHDANLTEDNMPAEYMNCMERIRAMQCTPTTSLIQLTCLFDTIETYGVIKAHFEELREKGGQQQFTTDSVVFETIRELKAHMFEAITKIRSVIDAWKLDESWDDLSRELGRDLQYCVRNFPVHNFLNMSLQDVETLNGAKRESGHPTGESY